MQRLLEERVIDRFMKCGDPHHGFARIYCPECRHDYLLPFSCKARYFCPSCHQKRVLAYELIDQPSARTLKAALSKERFVLQIVGPGGVGKTTFAAAIAQWAARAGQDGLAAHQPSL